MRRGLTLVETIIVLAIVAVIMTAGIVGMGQFRARLELRQAQQVVVSEFNRARSDARRSGVRQTVKWTADTITVTGDDGKERVTDLSSSDTIKIIFDGADVEGSFSYDSPYSTGSASREQIMLRRGTVVGENEVSILIYGVRGKVFASR